MGSEEPSEKTLSDFMEELFMPKQMTSFQGEIGTVSVSLFRSKDTPIQLTLPSIFPFMTLQDMKVAICIALSEQKDRVGEIRFALPEYLYLAQPFPGKKTKPVDYSWVVGASLQEGFAAPNPFDLVSGAVPLDTRFVDSAGERKILGLLQHERMTLEAKFLKKADTKFPVLHVYLYEDLYAAMPGPKPASERDWNGRLYPYFPMLGVGADTPSKKLVDHRNRLVEIFLKHRRCLDLLQTRAGQGPDLPLIPLSLAGIKYLRLLWAKPSKKIPGIEAMFYEAPVIQRMPFMRLLPSSGPPIAKVYFAKDGSPDIKPESLINQWAQEQSPTPERDFVLSKVLIRPQATNQPPIYGTFLLLDDGTANFLVEPYKGLKRILPYDLSKLDEYIGQVVQLFPQLSPLPDLARGDFIFGFKFDDPSTPPIKPSTLREKLRSAFSPVFQEIAPLPGENPLLMLRYKLVSNFVSEDRIFSYLTQLLNLKVPEGQFVSLVANEFQLDMEEAARRVAQKLQNQAEVSLVEPTLLEFSQQNNPGIDIAIFSTKNFYSFHIYRVDSKQNLERVLTFLSILFSIPVQNLVCNTEAGTAALVAAEEAEVAEGYGLAPGSKVEDVVVSPEVAPEVALGDAIVDNAEDEGNLDEWADYDLGAFGELGGDASALGGEAELESAVAVSKEGAALPEVANAVVASGLAPVLGQKDRPKTGADPVAELTGVVAPAPNPKLPVVAEDRDEAPTMTKKSLTSFFLNKLNEADSRLFDYAKENPLLKDYASQCQVTVMRQPAVFSDEKYQAMKREYYEDPVAWHEYPLSTGEELYKPMGHTSTDDLNKENFFTAIQYGTSRGNQNWYICSRYYCAHCEFVLLKSEFESAWGRPIRGVDGKRQFDSTGTLIRKAKEPMSCPFCKGKLIKNRSAPQPGETVFDRIVKINRETKTVAHLYTRFLKKTAHPEGFSLPCCFIEELPIRETDASYDKLRQLDIPVRKAATGAPASKAAADRLAKTAASPDEEDSDDSDEEFDASFDEPAKDETGVPILDYITVLNGITRRPNQHILGSEKFPLEIGITPPIKSKQKKGEQDKQPPAQPQVGLLLPPLDPYFAQTSKSLVERVGVLMQLTKGGIGFLRIGVENRQRYQPDSFLAAIAPYFNVNSVKKMKEFLLREIERNLKSYLSLNYGNLLLEFYRPTDRPKDMKKIENWIRLWAKTTMNIDMNDTNQEQIIRLYYSFNRFKAWLKETSTRKEYRQFAMMLAQSRFLRGPSKPGITFIVLDLLKGKKAGDPEILQVRCPPFGYNKETMGQNDVAFLLHHYSGVWEPLFYIDNRAPSVRGPESYTLLFEYAKRSDWPPIVETRLKEFISRCHSDARAVFTFQSKILSLKLIPVSAAKRELDKQSEIQYVGYIRDAYNHLVALMLRERKEGAPVVLLPVADDGTMFVAGEVGLDWDDIPADYRLGTANEAAKFYKQVVPRLFPMYSAYKPTELVQSNGSGDIEAIRLQNGIYIPVERMTRAAISSESTDLEETSVDEMEWLMNHEIMFEGDNAAELDQPDSVVEEKQLEEIYQHLRLTFSNWLAAVDGGGGVREALEGFAIRDDLPLFEKRRRMEMLLQPMITEWLTTDTSDKDEARSTSLLRVDCTIRPQGQCSGVCKWKAESSKCLIHVPSSPGKTSGPMILLRRLIDELLRYGERRRQLFQQEVTRIANLENRMIVLPGTATGEEQRIYSEKSKGWVELLRTDWGEKMDEAIYLEEMAEAPSAAALAPLTEKTRISATVETVLGSGDPKTTALRAFEGALQDFLVLAGLSVETIELMDLAEPITDEKVKSIVLSTETPMAYINPETTPPTVFMRRPFRAKPGFLLVFKEGGGHRLLVRDPDHPELPLRSEIPDVILAGLDKSKVAGLMVRKPAAKA